MSVSLNLDLPALPYDYNALEPHISEKTMHFHHDKHHASYVSTVKSKISGSGLEGQNIIRVIRGECYCVPRTAAS